MVISPAITQDHSAAAHYIQASSTRFQPQELASSRVEATKSSKAPRISSLWRSFTWSYLLRTDSAQGLQGIDQQLRGTRAIGSRNAVINVPYWTGLLNNRGERVTRIVPSAKQIATLLNYIDRDGQQTALTIALHCVTIPGAVGAWDQYHTQVRTLIRLNNVAIYCRVRYQGLLALPGHRMTDPRYANAVPYNDIPWHYITAAIRFGQAQLCGAGTDAFDEILRQLIDDKKFRTAQAWNHIIGVDGLTVDMRDPDRKLHKQHQ